MDAIVSASDGHVLEVRVEGTDASRTASALSVVRSALVEQQKVARDELLSQADEFEERIDSIEFDIDDETRSRLTAGILKTIEEAESLADDVPDVEDALPFTSIEVDYLHGRADWTVFEYYGPVFIGLFVFMFVFDVEVLTMFPRQERQQDRQYQESADHAPTEDIEEAVRIAAVILF